MVKVFWPSRRSPIRHSCSIVWSLSPQEAERMQQADDAEFNQKLNIAFDNRLGVVQGGERTSGIPVDRRYARQFAAHRLALVGDAAHTVHLWPAGGEPGLYGRRRAD
ncbi:FAD-dependent monooxygenase [Escherichia coli]